MITTEAIVVRAFGGPEVLRTERVALTAPGVGEVRMRHEAIGVNFHDVYVRSGFHKTLGLPGIPGAEAVGIVEEVGPGVTSVQVGDRVGYVTRTYGAYAADRLIPADWLIRIPEGIGEDIAGAILLKGLTAYMLLHKVHKVRPGEKILIHAAAGAVGQLLVQWAHHLGARILGTVGSPEKAELALAAGCEEICLYRDEDFVERASGFSNGRGMDVVFDAVGRDTMIGSLQCLAMRGHLVSYGQASGPIEPVSVPALAEKSATLSRPAVFHFISDAAERQEMADALFEALSAHVLRPDRVTPFALTDADAAHRLLEARLTSGPVILRPR
jgi:NADPH:quinone reductase